MRWEIFADFFLFSGVLHQHICCPGLVDVSNLACASARGILLIIPTFPPLCSALRLRARCFCLASLCTRIVQCSGSVYSPSYGECRSMTIWPSLAERAYASVTTTRPWVSKRARPGVCPQKTKSKGSKEAASWHGCAEPYKKSQQTRRSLKRAKSAAASSGGEDERDVATLADATDDDN